MNHGDVKKNLADYLEGDVSLDVRALVDAHLDECGECAEEVSQMQETIQLLRRLPEPEPPPMIAADVMRRIRAGETEPGLGARMLRGLTSIFEPSFVLPASAIAVAAVVFVVIQDPASIPSLGSLAGEPGSERSTQAGGAGQNAGVAGGLERRASRAFGASAAQEYLPRSTAAMRDPRARIQFEISRSGAARDTRVGNSTRRPSGRGAGYPTGLAEPRRGLVPVEGGARAVAQPRSVTRDARQASSVASVDRRDQWLSVGLENPADFARFIAGRNLAEQELWVARLAERAESRGLLDELVGALRAAGSAEAIWVANDFAAQAARYRGALSGAESPGLEAMIDSLDASSEALESR